MDKLKRRNFMKMCGIAAAIPSCLLKGGINPIKRFSKESMYVIIRRNYKGEANLSVETFYDGKWIPIGGRIAMRS